MWSCFVLALAALMWMWSSESESLRRIGYALIAGSLASSLFDGVVRGATLTTIRLGALPGFSLAPGDAGWNCDHRGWAAAARHVQESLIARNDIPCPGVRRGGEISFREDSWACRVC